MHLSKNTFYIASAFIFASLICSAQTYKVKEGEGFNSHLLVGQSIDVFTKAYPHKLDSTACLLCPVMFSQERKYKFNGNDGVEITLTDSTNTINRITFTKKNFTLSSGIHAGSGKDEVVSKYGPPEKIARDIQDNCTKYYYPQKGVSIGIKNDTVVNATIFPKDSLVYRELPVGLRKPYLAARDSFSIEGKMIDFIWSKGETGTDDREGILIKIISSSKKLGADTVIVNKLASEEEHYNRGKLYRLTVTPTRPFYGGDFVWTTYMKYEKYKYYCFSIKQVE